MPREESICERIAYPRSRTQSHQFRITFSEQAIAKESEPCSTEPEQSSIGAILAKLSQIASDPVCYTEGIILVNVPRPKRRREEGSNTQKVRGIQETELFVFGGKQLHPTQGGGPFSRSSFRLVLPDSPFFNWSGAARLTFLWSVMWCPLSSLYVVSLLSLSFVFSS